MLRELTLLPNIYYPSLMSLQLSGFEKKVLEDHSDDIIWSK